VLLDVFKGMSGSEIANLEEGHILEELKSKGTSGLISQSIYQDIAKLRSREADDADDLPPPYPVDPVRTLKKKNLPKNANVKEFWEHYFGKKQKVDNYKFQKVMENLFENIRKEDCKDGDDIDEETIKDSNRLFAKALSEQVFCPDVGDPNVPSYVDQDCIEFAIKTFGPWKTIFQNIHKNLEDDTQSIKPILYFHGRISEEILNKHLTKIGDFALRYDKKEGIILSWAKPGMRTNFKIKHEKIIRSKRERNRWLYKEHVPSLNRMKIEKKYFNTLGEFINDSKKRKGILRPILFGSAYGPNNQFQSRFVLDEVNKLGLNFGLQNQVYHKQQKFKTNF